MNSKLKGLALTFDDILLVPGESEVLPKNTDISSTIARDIKVNIPIVSAAMDTVTDLDMAIAVAREGGIGFVHKNMPAEIQAEVVRKVKRSESWIIADPVTIHKDATIGDVKEVFVKNNITGVPVLDANRVPIGIVTNRDLRFIEPKDYSRHVSEVMTKNPITVGENTHMDRCKELLHEKKIEKLLVVDKQGKLAGMITFKDISLKGEHPHACVDSQGRLRVAAAAGVTDEEFKRVELLVEAGVDLISIDTAHGHHINVINMVKRVKKAFSNISLCAGNIATQEAALALIDAGADVLKVGIGPGSICTTRVIAGVGVPQITAIENVKRATLANGNIPIIADGGIRFSGDIVKALAVGADVVMVGNLLAGTDESPGETVLLEGRTFKTYRGMGSLGAMKKGSGDRYFQEKTEETAKYVPEGIEGIIPYRGKAKDILYQLSGGVRSGMGYLGAKNIKELQKKATFYQITDSGYKESHPHTLKVTKEAPNYKIE